MKKILLICLLFSISLFLQAGFAKEGQHFATEQQHILNNLTTQLDDLDYKLNHVATNDNQVQSIENSLEDILLKAATIQKATQLPLKQAKDLLDSLGIEPKATGATEDKITQKKRQELTDKISNYDGLIRQAGSIIYQTQALLDKLTAVQLKIKAKGLLVRQFPLYDVSVWEDAWQDKAATFTALAANYHEILHDLKKGFSLSFNRGIFLFYCALGVFLVYPVGHKLYTTYGIRRKDAFPAMFSKTMTGIVQMICKVILPLSALALALFSLNICHFFPYDSRLVLRYHFLALSMCLMTFAATNIILAPQNPNWRILPLQPHSAKSLRLLFTSFMTGVAVVWLATKLAILDVFPTDSFIVSDFLLRVSICFIGLMLIRHKNWEFDLPDNPTYKLTDHKIILLIKVLAFFIFLMNPVLVFFGYIELAKVLFLGFTQTIVAMMVLLCVHVIFDEIVQRFLKIDRGIDEKEAHIIDLENKKKETKRYWLMLFADSVLVLIGLYYILLACGIENDYILRYVKPFWTGIKIGQYEFSIATFILASAIFSILYFLTRFIQNLLNHHIFPHTSLGIGEKQAIKQGIGYIGITLAVISSIVALGFSFTHLAIIAGALSVGIGFGMQSIVGNFISGIIMLVERPIKIGDRIVVAEDEGIVKKISVRTTEIETYDRATVLIPNSDLITKKIKNWTFDSPLNRLAISVSVSYGSNVHQVKKLLLEVAHEHPDVVSEPAAKVYFDDFADSALIFRLLVYIYDIDKRSSVPSELRFEIEKKFKEHDIEMPFPQSVVYIKEMPDVKQASARSKIKEPA